MGASLNSLVIQTVSADPVSPVEGQIQISDGTARSAGLYTYDGSGWIAAPNSLTASNLGAGEGVFAQKVGDEVQLKSLVAGANINLLSDSNELTIQVNSNRSTTKTMQEMVPGNPSTISYGAVTETLVTNAFTGLTIGREYQININVLTQYADTHYRLYTGSGDVVTTGTGSGAGGTSTEATFTADATALTFQVRYFGGIGVNVDTTQITVKLLEFKIEEEIEGDF